MAKYKPEQIEKHLMGLVLADGNIAEYRKAGGKDIPERTLRSWRDDTQVELYQRLEADRAEQAMERIGAGAERSAELAGEVEIMLMQSVLRTNPEALDKTTVNVRMSAAAKASTVKGVNVEKSLLVRGRPTSITQNQSVPDMLRALKRFGIVKAPDEFIEADAEEIPPEALPPGKRRPESASNGNSEGS